MTKADLVGHVYDKLGISKQEASKLVECVFEVIKESLEKGENIKISGFGTFVLKEKKEREGRIPMTGETITIAARKVLSFRPSHSLKASMNR